MSHPDRPIVHLTPPAGWMNDPNGLMVRDGEFHALFQHEPDVPRWGRMRWGHAVSRDLLHWDHKAVALEPDPEGPDRDGCWSGCLVADDAGRPTIFYTGVARERGMTRASIMTATSDDGLETWTKGPVVVDRPPRGVRADRFRDPFLWRDEGGWAMLVGAGTTNRRGLVTIYRSDDLVAWRYAGPFLTTDDVIASDPSVVIDDIDSPCWECPQLVRLGEVDALIVSVVDRAPRIRPAHVMIFTGSVVGDRFVVRHTDRLGLGPDFYAPATLAMPDGRTLLFGWIPEDPPRPTSTRSWAGAFTLPRRISVDDDGRPTISLAAETERIGGRPTRMTNAPIPDGERWVHHADDGHLDLRLTLRPGDAASIRLDVAGESGAVFEIRFDPRDRRLAVARTGRVAVAGRDPHGSTTLPGPASSDLHLRLVLDGSILELEADHRVTATARLPDVGGLSRTITCTPLGGACELVDVDVSTIV